MCPVCIPCSIWISGNGWVCKLVCVSVLCKSFVNEYVQNSSCCGLCKKTTTPRMISNKKDRVPLFPVLFYFFAPLPTLIDQYDRLWVFKIRKSWTDVKRTVKVLHCLGQTDRWRPRYHSHTKKPRHKGGAWSCGAFCMHRLARGS